MGVFYGACAKRHLEGAPTRSESRADGEAATARIDRIGFLPLYGNSILPQLIPDMSSDIPPSSDAQLLAATGGECFLGFGHVFSEAASPGIRVHIPSAMCDTQDPTEHP